MYYGMRSNEHLGMQIERINGSPPCAGFSLGVISKSFCLPQLFIAIGVEGVCVKSM